MHRNVRVADDDRQQVVEIVRDAAGHADKTIQFTRLTGLLLKRTTPTLRRQSSSRVRTNRHDAEQVPFVIADGIGANLERADIINRLGHGALLIIVFLVLAVSVGIRTRHDEKPGRRIVSSSLLGLVSAVYALGLSLLEYEPEVMAVMLALIGIGVAGVAVMVSAAVVTRLKKSRPEGPKN